MRMPKPIFTPSAAEALGRDAFHKGLRCLPLLDLRFMIGYRQFTQDHPKMGEGQPLFKAWSKGFMHEQRLEAARTLAATGEFETFPSIIEFRQAPDKRLN